MRTLRISVKTTEDKEALYRAEAALRSIGVVFDTGMEVGDPE